MLEPPLTSPDSASYASSIAAKQRLDAWLVQRGLAHSLEKARAAVLAGDVLVDGERARRPAAGLDEGARVELAQRPRYVGRGGAENRRKRSAATN